MARPILRHLLSSEEFHLLVKGIIDAINKSNIDPALKTKLINKLNENYLNFVNILDRLRKNPLTTKVHFSDGIRDARFLCFRNYVESQLYHWEIANAEAAQLLVEVIQRHGWSLHTGGFTGQTSACNAMLAELKGEKTQEAIEIIKAAEYLQQVESSERDFEILMQERDEQNAKEKPQLINTRKQLYKDLVVVIQSIENLIELNLDEDISALKELNKNVDQIILTITSMARARKTRKKEDAEVEVDENIEQDN